MNWWIIIGLIITMLGSGITVAGYVKQLKSNSELEKRTELYQNQLLQNQAKIIETGEASLIENLNIKESINKSNETIEKLHGDNRPSFTIEDTYVNHANIDSKEFLNLELMLITKNSGIRTAFARSVDMIILLNDDYGYIENTDKLTKDINGQQVVTISYKDRFPKYSSANFYLYFNVTYFDEVNNREYNQEFYFKYEASVQNRLQNAKSTDVKKIKGLLSNKKSLFRWGPQNMFDFD